MNPAATNRPHLRRVRLPGTVATPRVAAPHRPAPTRECPGTPADRTPRRTATAVPQPTERPCRPQSSTGRHPAH